MEFMIPQDGNLLSRAIQGVTFSSHMPEKQKIKISNQDILWTREFACLICDISNLIFNTDDKTWLNYFKLDRQPISSNWTGTMIFVAVTFGWILHKTLSL